MKPPIRYKRRYKPTMQELEAVEHRKYFKVVTPGHEGTVRRDTFLRLFEQVAEDVKNCEGKEQQHDN